MLTLDQYHEFKAAVWNDDWATARGFVEANVPREDRAKLLRGLEQMEKAKRKHDAR